MTIHQTGSKIFSKFLDRVGVELTRPKPVGPKPRALATPPKRSSDRETERQRDRERDRQRDRQRKRQRDRQIDRQMDR